MTVLTLHLPDSLVSQAKLQGVFNEKALNEVLYQYLQQQLKQKSLENPWQSFFIERDQVDIPEAFMAERLQPAL